MEKLFQIMLPKKVPLYSLYGIILKISSFSFVLPFYIIPCYFYSFQRSWINSQSMFRTDFSQKKNCIHFSLKKNWKSKEELIQSYFHLNTSSAKKVVGGVEDIRKGMRHIWLFIQFFYFFLFFFFYRWDWDQQFELSFIH